MTFRILSLDGGGVRGAYTAAVLAEIEEGSGKRVADHFDLIAGTSTGGIIALGLGLGMSAKEISQFYVNDGPRIFDQINPFDSNSLASKITAWFRAKRNSSKQLAATKYGSSELRKALERAFQ